MKIPPVPQGFARQWVQCLTCQGVSYYDYTPYGLGNPIMILPCGHNVAKRWENSVRNISVEQALAVLVKDL